MRAGPKVSYVGEPGRPTIMSSTVLLIFVIFDMHVCTVLDVIVGLPGFPTYETLGPALADPTVP